MDNQNKLKVRLTYGDMRKGLLRGLTLKSLVDEITNENFNL